MKLLLIAIAIIFTVSACKKNESRAVFQPKTVYYRIKSVDKNGVETVSQVRVVEEK